MREVDAGMTQTRGDTWLFHKPLISSVALGKSSHCRVLFLENGCTVSALQRYYEDRM